MQKTVRLITSMKQVQAEINRHTKQYTNSYG